MCTTVSWPVPEEFDAVLLGCLVDAPEDLVHALLQQFEEPVDIRDAAERQVAGFEELLQGTEAGGMGRFSHRPEEAARLLALPDDEFLAMFQVPNKFFERDGRVADASGKDWEQTWAHVLGK